MFSLFQHDRQICLFRHKRNSPQSTIRIKIGMIWKKGKYISDNMQKFLNFTRMYYREHPLIQKF